MWHWWPFGSHCGCPCRYLRTLYKAEEMKQAATVYTPEIQEVDKEMDRYSLALFEVSCSMG